jgi:hypothetical protein
LMLEFVARTRKRRQAPILSLVTRPRSVSR